MYLITNVFQIFCISYKIEKNCKYCKIEKLSNDEILFMALLIKIK